MLLVVMNIISIPIVIISPKLFQILVDDVMKSEEISKIVWVFIGLLLVYVLRFIIDGANLYCNNKMINSFTVSIRRELLDKYLKLPVEKFEKYDVGDIKMRISEDVDNLGNFVKSQIVDYLYNIVLLIVCLFISLSINVYMTVICVLIIPLVLIVNRMIGQRVKKVNREIRDVSERYYTFEQNAFCIWKDIRYNNLENSFFNAFKGFREKLAKLGMKSIKLWGVGEVFGDFKSNYLTTIFVYIVGGFFVLEGSITVGTIVMFSQYYAMLFTSIDIVNSKSVELKTSEPFYEKIFEILNILENTKPKKNITSIESIKIEGLSFGYNKRIFLENINLIINKKETIAVAGKSGIGKTTLAKLLLGFYRPSKGRILFNDMDLEDIQKDSLYHLTGVVMQNPYLFNMTIKENLQIANKNANMEEMIAVCKKADIYSFIKNQPNYFDTIIGERGIKLSGGQKQKLTIARALIRQPQLLILDEATNSVDHKSEERIIANIHNANTTTIIISHNPNVLKQATSVINI